MVKMEMKPHNMTMTEYYLTHLAFDLIQLNQGIGLLLRVLHQCSYVQEVALVGRDLVVEVLRTFGGPLQKLEPNEKNRNH